MSSTLHVTAPSFLQLLVVVVESARALLLLSHAGVGDAGHLDTSMLLHILVVVVESTGALLLSSHAGVGDAGHFDTSMSCFLPGAVGFPYFLDLDGFDVVVNRLCFLFIVPLSAAPESTLGPPCRCG